MAREEARGAARRSETIRIPVGVDRLQSSATPGRRTQPTFLLKKMQELKRKRKKILHSLNMSLAADNTSSASGG